MKILIIGLMLISILCGCKNTNESIENVFAMDTEMTVKAYGKNSDMAVSDAKNEIYRIDRLLRRGAADSEVYKINNERTAKVSEDTARLINAALEISKATDGMFDITIAPVMDKWGFYTKEFRVPSDNELKEILPEINYNNVTVSKDTVTLSGMSQIDLGGIAKGFLSDRIIEIYKNNGIKSGIVSLGGNVQTLGTKADGSKWRVAVQNPDGDQYIGIISAENKAVITSGNYQRFFVENGILYHHIINPRTGKPASGSLQSVTIVSDTGTMADGLSTAIFVMGLEKGIEYWREHSGFDVIFVTEDNNIYITEGIKDIFESDLEYETVKK